MRFELSIFILRQPEECFAFLRDKDTYPQKPGSAVLVLDKTTPGPAGVGTRYREVVRMFPFVTEEILSEITRFDPPEWLDETFESSWMRGDLSYQFVPEGEGTRLIQREQLHLPGILRIFEPIIKRMMAPRLRSRLEEIKKILEGGWNLNTNF